MKIFKKILITLLLIIFAAAAGTYFYLYNKTRPVIKSEDNTALVQEKKFEIPFGTSLYTISMNLEEEGLIKSGRLFYYFTRYPEFLKYFFPKDEIPAESEPKSGTYYIKNNLSYPQIISLLTSGQQELIKVSIPEGLTITKIAEILEQNNICEKNDFIQTCHNKEFVEELGIAGDSLEGYLFPDTYFLNSGMGAKRVITIFTDNFFKQIADIPNLGEKTREEIKNTVILASIIEREYRIADEAPLISSVFTNRLKYNIGLYSCATVEYIITEIEGRPHPDRILIDDTRIDNPYNTYLYAGLTPGPISNPGRVALNAAANPEKTNYFYFQIVDVNEGRHVFSTTFDQHISNHSLYTKKASGK